jgi:hypothetical protein
MAPENSLPQLGQVRWDSVFIELTALQPQRRSPPSGAKLAFTVPGKAVVPFHKQLRVHLS